MTNQPPPMYAYPPPQPPAKKRRKWPWITAGVVGFLIILGSVSNNGDSNNGKPSGANDTNNAAAPQSPAVGSVPTQEAAPAPPPAPAGPASEITKDGTFLVGMDIVPGTYRSAGGSRCYWERDKDLEGDVGSIIANSNADGQQVVTILPTDKAFQTQNCGVWTLIPS